MKIMPHPEAKEGEVYIANVTLNNFETVTFHTKRMGVVPLAWADDATIPVGYVLPAKRNLYPLFVQRAELKARGVTLTPFDLVEVATTIGGHDYEEPEEDVLIGESLRIIEHTSEQIYTIEKIPISFAIDVAGERVDLRRHSGNSWTLFAENGAIYDWIVEGPGRTYTFKKRRGEQWKPERDDYVIVDERVLQQEQRQNRRAEQQGERFRDTPESPTIQVIMAILDINRGDAAFLRNAMEIHDVPEVMQIANSILDAVHSDTLGVSAIHGPSDHGPYWRDTALLFVKRVASPTMTGYVTLIYDVELNRYEVSTLAAWADIRGARLEVGGPDYEIRAYRGDRHIVENIRAVMIGDIENILNSYEITGLETFSRTVGVQWTRQYAEVAANLWKLRLREMISEKLRESTISQLRAIIEHLGLSLFPGIASLDIELINGMMRVLRLLPNADVVEVYEYVGTLPSITTHPILRLPRVEDVQRIEGRGADNMILELLHAAFDHLSTNELRSVNVMVSSRYDDAISDIGGEQEV